MSGITMSESRRSYFRFESFQRGVAVGHGGHGVASVVERALDELADRGLVVGDQHPFFVLR